MNGPAEAERDMFTPPARPAAQSADRTGASAPAPPSPAGRRLAPSNWRVPTRLYAILLIPVTVGLVMGGFQVKSSVSTWRQAEDAERTARVVQAALTYGHRLVEERDVSTAPLLRGHRDDPAVAKARAATDRAAAAFDSAARRMPHTEGLERRLAAFRKTESGLAELRAGAFTSRLGGVRTEEGYVAVQHPLMEFANELGLGTGNITSYGRTVYAISLTKAAVSLQRSIGTHLLVRPGPAPADLGRQRTALSSYAYLEGISIEEYLSGGTPQDESAFTRAAGGPTAGAAESAEEKAAADRAQGRRHVPPPPHEAMASALATLPGTRPAERRALARKGITEDSWWQANTARFDADRTIEADLTTKAVHEAAVIADEARRAAFVTGTGVLIALLTAFVLAGLMARQMSRSMSGLRTAALGIAQQRLPMIVDQLSRTEPGRVDTRVAPLPITTTDEIGEVARAFDQVHREAVRLAAEQALLRGNVNAILANLSRRNESLIDGQLSLISDLETHETDPDQLASLFRLDHLATRMRRNGENLLVLSGEQPGRSWEGPVPLVDVLRAASSEVEQYHRIELAGVPDSANAADIHGLAVTDLVHLLAELLENAIMFSSPQTRVRVAATRMPDGRIMIEIHDQGIGLTPADCADINRRLARPPAVDAALSQRMGLFVVGRLADRHRIRVQLRPSAEPAGTTALVMLPGAITHGGGAAQPEPEFTVSSMIPEKQAQTALPLRTAAELGFDDSRYGDAPAPAAGVDPVSRSQRRGERHAAARAQAQPDRNRDGKPSGSTAPAGEPAPAAPGAPHGAQGAHDRREAYAQAAYRPLRAPYAHGDRSPSGGGRQAAYGTLDASYGGTEATARHAFRPGGFAEEAGTGRYTEADEAGRTGAGQEPLRSRNSHTHLGQWARQGRFQVALTNEQGNQAESVDVTDGNTGNRVGFTRSDEVPGSRGTAPELTGAGLPRRDVVAGGEADGTVAPPGGPGRHRREGCRRTPPRDPAAAQPGQGASRSANDERWERAASLRVPRAGGITPSGLPRRTPKANLVAGAAEQTPQGGPRVSRAPRDVGGRLNSLRRGVQRAHSEGSTSKGRTGTGLDRGPAGHDSTEQQER